MAHGRVDVPEFSGAAVLNGCDPAGDLLGEVTPAGVRRIRYGAPSRGPAAAELDLRAEATEVDWSGTRVSVEIAGRLAAELGMKETELSVRAIGSVYAENALAAFIPSTGPFEVHNVQVHLVGLCGECR